MSIKNYLKSKIPERYKSFLRKIRLKFLRIIHRDLDFIYNEDFSMSPLMHKDWVGIFCDLILKDFDPKSIIDFGCGTGDILAPFERKGLVVLGVDGSSACKRRSKIKQSNFLLFDLRDTFKCEKKYDLCFCFEVAEHLEEKYSDQLISNLASSSSTILFSAARPGQDGHDHVNEKPQGWWIEKFQKYGLIFDKEMTDALKNKISNIPGVQHYYISNLMVYKSAH